MISKVFLPGQLYGTFEARLEKWVQFVQVLRKGVKSTNSTREREWAKSERKKVNCLKGGENVTAREGAVPEESREVVLDEYGGPFIV